MTKKSNLGICVVYFNSEIVLTKSDACILMQIFIMQHGS